MSATDSTDAQRVVDELKAAGADMIKTYHLITPQNYYAVARAARTAKIPFGGHVQHEPGITATEASDSGARILDHINAAGGIDSMCLGMGDTPETATVKTCGPIAERFRKNGTWFSPTLIAYARYGVQGSHSQDVLDRVKTYNEAVRAGSMPSGNWLRGSAPATTSLPPDSTGIMSIPVAVGMPLLAGTDVADALDAGMALHGELSMLVAEGATPLDALRAATLNPAKMWGSTDSLGTVAPGKLADLVLLDANPLADITNSTTIRAVVADGRYYDRAALDQLIVNARSAKPISKVGP